MAPLNIDLSSPKPSTRSMRSTSTSTSQSTSLPNAFNRIMGGAKETSDLGVIRDTYLHLTLEYNLNYNPYVVPREDLRQGYSPYVPKEPLFDDRPAIVAQLPINYVLAPVPKRPRTSWVWRLRYAITNTSKPRKPMLMWHCKLCKYWCFVRFLTNF
jgi:hypothetical protein